MGPASLFLPRSWVRPMLQDHWPHLEKQGSGSIVLKSTILPQRGHLAISGDTFGCHSWKMGTIGLEGEKSRML